MPNPSSGRERWSFGSKSHSIAYLDALFINDCLRAIPDFLILFFLVLLKKGHLTKNLDSKFLLTAKCARFLALLNSASMGRARQAV